MEVIDFTNGCKNKTIKHNKNLPNSIRMIITGPSGSGKTQLMLSLIMKHLKWDKLYVIAPSLDDQPCYDVLKVLNENLKSAMKSDEDQIEFFHQVEESPIIDEIDAEKNNLIVFDDVMMDNQKNIARLFSRGRHKNTDLIYATQRYSQIPKVIRDNCNMICLFNSVDNHAINNIHKTWCDGDMSIDKFKKIIKQTKDNYHNFITISLHDPNNRYRVGLGTI